MDAQLSVDGTEAEAPIPNLPPIVSSQAQRADTNNTHDRLSNQVHYRQHGNEFFITLPSSSSLSSV